MRIRKAVITAAGRNQRGIPLQTLVDRDGIEKKGRNDEVAIRSLSSFQNSRHRLLVGCCLVNWPIFNAVRITI